MFLIGVVVFFHFFHRIDEQTMSHFRSIFLLLRLGDERKRRRCRMFFEKDCKSFSALFELRWKRENPLKLKLVSKNHQRHCLPSSPRRHRKGKFEAFLSFIKSSAFILNANVFNDEGVAKRTVNEPLNTKQFIKTLTF